MTRIRAFILRAFPAPVADRRAVIDALNALEPYPAPRPCEVRHPVKVVTEAWWMKQYAPDHRRSA